VHARITVDRNSSQFCGCAGLTLPAKKPQSSQYVTLLQQLCSGRKVCAGSSVHAAQGDLQAWQLNTCVLSLTTVQGRLFEAVLVR
jgi:hypothetical protein